MKKTIAGVLVLLGLASYAGAQYETQSYILRRVVVAADTAKCAAEGGKGSLVFELGADGQPSTEFEPFCLLPAPTSQK